MAQREAVVQLGIAAVNGAAGEQESGEDNFEIEMAGPQPPQSVE